MSGNTYKRSWKNLLLNKRYQLRFTLFMAGISAGLMILLGLWVMTVANRATKVSINNVLGEVDCTAPVGGAAGTAPDPAPASPASMDADDQAADMADEGDGEVAEAAEQADIAEDAEEAEDAEDAEPSEDAQDDGEAAKEGEGAAAGGGTDDGGRPIVTLDESSMELDLDKAPPMSADVDHAATKEGLSLEDCRAKQAGKIEDLKDRKQLIFWVLIAVGTILTLGLMFYGIKTTHRVAGPLYKVGLYLDKLRDGRYDAVYNLRKGDQLIEFYNHFKQAHAGMTKWQTDDIERLKAVLAAAEDAKLESKSPEVAEAMSELRELLAKKEKSLG